MRKDGESLNFRYRGVFASRLRLLYVVEGVGGAGRNRTDA